MVNRFVLNETSYHGAGAIKSIADEAKGRAFKKAFVCSDPDLVKFGVTQKVLDVLEGAGLDYELYSNIKPNPTIENVQTGVAACKAAGADYIIAIGGGSSMDTAKGVGIIMENPDFADVRSLEGCCRYQTQEYADFCCTDDSRYRCRGYDQLRYYRCREEPQDGMCGSA